MAFEIIEKHGNLWLEKMTVAISNGIITFSKDIRKMFEGFWGCEVYLDMENNLMGFKGSNDKNISYAFTQSNRRNLCTRKAAKGIESGRYPAKLEKEMIVIKFTSLEKCSIE
ncbi:MAG: hypothetical protein IH845_03860 [Nanoarchaeota archaeon]|nr:hypothetical protein [Nanoarchaeota archaeon]